MNPVSTTPPNHQQLYEIAEQQAGYFTAAQAQAVGFSRPLLSYYTKVGRFSRREVLIEHQLIVDDRNTFGDQICAILSGPISTVSFFHSFQQESIVITGTDNGANKAIACQPAHPRLGDLRVAGQAAYPLIGPPYGDEKGDKPYVQKEETKTPEAPS